jgi:hypothetical protein
LNLKFNKSNLITSLFISIAFYLITFFVLNAIKFSSVRLPDLQEVHLNIRHYKKHIVKEESRQNQSPKPTPSVPKKKVKKKEINREIIPTKTIMSIKETDSTLFVEGDVLIKDINWLDSMVVNNPNILMLKYAAKDQLKNNSIKISDSARTVETIKSIMQNYFKSKYPTPVHKFGDGSPGIPIDKILDIFRGDDTLDVKKIKRYLKLEGYE